MTTHTARSSVKSSNQCSTPAATDTPGFQEREGTCEFVRLADLQGLQLHGQRTRRDPSLLQRDSVGRIDRVVKHTDAGGLWPRRLEYLELLAAQFSGEVRQARGISARLGEAGYEPTTHRVARQGEHDRDRRCDGLRRLRRDRSSDHEHIHPKGNEFSREFGNLVESAGGMPVLDDDVLALCIAT